MESPLLLMTRTGPPAWPQAGPGHVLPQGWFDHQITPAQSSQHLSTSLPCSERRCPASTLQGAMGGSGGLYEILGTSKGTVWPGKWALVASGVLTPHLLALLSIPRLYAAL